MYHVVLQEPDYVEQSCQSVPKSECLWHFFLLYLFLFAGCYLMKQLQLLSMVVYRKKNVLFFFYAPTIPRMVEGHIVFTLCV